MAELVMDAAAYTTQMAARFSAAYGKDMAMERAKVLAQMADFECAPRECLDAAATMLVEWYRLRVWGPLRPKGAPTWSMYQSDPFYHISLRLVAHENASIMCVTTLRDFLADSAPRLKTNESSVENLLSLFNARIEELAAKQEGHEPVKNGNGFARDRALSALAGNTYEMRVSTTESEPLTALRYKGRHKEW